MHQPPLPAAPRRRLAALQTQGALSADSFQWPAAPAPCTPACGLEASSGSPATGEGQPGSHYGPASPGWWSTTLRPPATLGLPKAPSPAPAGWLYAGHLPGAEPQPPPVAACRASWPARLSTCGPQQPPQLWLKWIQATPLPIPPSWSAILTPELQPSPCPGPAPRSPFRQLVLQQLHLQALDT